MQRMPIIYDGAYFLQKQLTHYCPYVPFFNLRFSDIFREYQKGAPGSNRLTAFYH